MSPHQFQLIGGDPLLDFVNTVHDWTAPEARDYVPTFAEVLRFAEVAGVISAAEAKRLASASTGAELRRLRELRARLERILRALVAGRAPALGDLDSLARDGAEAARGSRWWSEKGRLMRGIDPGETGAATVRLRLIEAAVALLTSDRVARMSACPSCGWFFLDTTKNKSRRWCSMAMCGNPAKARAYYRRRRPGSRPHSR